MYGWHAGIERKLPWKSDAEPYSIWISEIILQQTRVAQGTPYYLKFMETFPSVRALAEASEEQVLKAWEGLGYYSRARNLHSAAKTVVSVYQGSFPDTYEGLLALKGVGPYTAAAIASFAFNRAHAVMDGNVMRVISRIFGISEPIDTSAGRKIIQALATDLLDKDNPGKFNQAMMDFGALHCSPSKPDCLACPFQADCLALRNDLVDFLPVKSVQIKKKVRYFHYFLLENEWGVLIGKRVKEDIWKGLFELPMLETSDESVGRADVTDFLIREMGAKLPGNLVYESHKLKKHILTHREIRASLHKIETKFELNPKSGTYFFVPREKLGNFAFPKILHEIRTLLA